MSEITVRRLTEEQWEEYRTIRLRALQESPEAFVATYAEQAAEPEEAWRARMTRAIRFVAERDGTAVGVVSLGDLDPDRPAAAEIFGLWVAPEARDEGVATLLVDACASEAAAQGRTHVYYWVGTENGRAVAFASGFGFRPTNDRRPMRVVSEEDGEEEIAMVLPLGGDRGWLG